MFRDFPLSSYNLNTQNKIRVHLTEILCGIVGVDGRSIYHSQ
jgi:hypothetical protein